MEFLDFPDPLFGCMTHTAEHLIGSLHIHAHVDSHCPSMEKALVHLTNKHISKVVSVLVFRQPIMWT